MTSQAFGATVPCACCECQGVADQHHVTGMDGIVFQHFIEHRHGCDGRHGKRETCNTNATTAAECDEARAKLDAVRAVVAEEMECLLHPDDDPVQCGWKQTVRRVAAIIDAEGSTRPQEATGDASGTPGPDNA